MPAPYQSVSSQVRPSKLWFLLAGGVALAAIVVGFVVIGVAGVGYVDEIENLHRIEAPGSGRVELSRAGGYSIYYELPAPAFGPSAHRLLRPHFPLIATPRDEKSAQMKSSRRSAMVAFVLHSA